ncbi:ead/Ea22-like family protein, partial [Salmonella enterica]
AAEKATKGNYVVGHNNINQQGHLSSVFVCQEWRGEAGGVVAECHVNCLTETSEQVYANAEFIAVANPRTMLALLDENLQLQREKDAIEAVALALRDDMRQAREQLEAAEKRNAEQREYYEGVIADGSKRIAELEKGHQEAAKQINSWRRLAKQNIAERGKDISELEAARQRIAELEAEPVSQAYNLPELIEGMEVSIDVSTCDADVGNRYFGTVTEVSELDTAKNGYILLVQDAKPNFDVNGNSPVIPDDWISCSERMPAQDDWVLIYSNHGEYLAGQVQGEYVELSDGTLSWLGSALHWMLLPEPPQEVKSALEHGMQRYAGAMQKLADSE